MFISPFLATVADFLAQTTGPILTTQPAQPAAPGWVKMIQSMGTLFPLILVMVIFIWMSTRTRKRQEKQKQDMISSMKRGDRVQTIGGILGNVVETRDDRILLKVDESNNTKVWFARSAIHRVIGDEAEAK